MKENKNKENSSLFRFLRANKRLLRELFVFGNKKSKKDALQEEELMSPLKQVFKKFIHNKLAIIGLFIFISIVLFIVIGNAVIDFIPEEKETTQIALAPNRSQLKVPSKLKKSGVKIVEVNGNKNYLIDGGVAFTAAISKDNIIYVWGNNVNDVKEIPNSIKLRAKDIVQLEVGSTHIVCLTNDGEVLGWGKNNFEQAQIPIYNDQLDSSVPYKKTIQAYFDPSVRGRFANDIVSIKEDDPIIKIDAGYEYTSILTQSGKVYSWGNTKSSGISEASTSFNYLNIRLRIEADNLEFKYTGANTWEKLMDISNIPTLFGLTIKEDDPFVYRILGSTLQYKYESEASWINLSTAEELTSSIEKRKIINIKAYNDIIVYFFDNGMIDLVGLEGVIKSSAPTLLSQSNGDRGFSIIDIAISKSNGFALTSKGDIFGWGDYNAENKITDIPKFIQDKNIVAIDAGIHHVVVLDDKGIVETWGYNNRLNQLEKPRLVDNSLYISANYFNSFSIDSNGKVTIWGNKGYFFGTDLFGADNFSRIIAGGGMTLSVAAVAVIVSLIIGLIIGLVAGFYGGWIDNLLMRFGEIISAFPFLPLAMTLAKIIEDKGVSENIRIYMIMVILGLLSWPGLARLVRGQILSEREKDFVMASKALGIREKHIITRHILPNVINVVIVSTTLSYAGTLLTEAGLSYLGFGVKYPRPSWGNLLNNAKSMNVLNNYWWIWIIPALFLIGTALSINLVGDGLREAMDPKSSER